jgi:hypothetical protein
MLNRKNPRSATINMTKDQAIDAATERLHEIPDPPYYFVEIIEWINTWHNEKCKTCRCRGKLCPRTKRECDDGVPLKTCRWRRFKAWLLKQTGAQW